MLLWVLFLVCVLLVYLKCVKPMNYWKNVHVPYVKPWPVIGNMDNLLLRKKIMAHWIQDIYNSHQNTRYVGLYMFSNPLLMVKDLDLIKQMAIKDFDHFVDHRPFLNEDIDPLFGKNLFFLRGQKWRNMRSTLSPAFTGSKMRSMFVLISKCADQLTNYFLERLETEKTMIIEMKDTFTRYASDVIATSAFGINCNSMEDRENEFYVTGKDASTFGGSRRLKFLGFGISPKLMRLLNVKIFGDTVNNFFRKVIKDNIREREEHGIVRPDMVHLLMEARKGKLKHDDAEETAGFATVEESHVGKDSKQAIIDLSDDDITAQAILFFIAGFETISTVMCHLTYELALNVDIQRRLQEEIDEALEGSGGKVTYDLVMKLNYLDMCLSETLRKWPPLGAVDRYCVEPYTIQPEKPKECPLTINKGDLIWFPIYALHHDPIYFPNPEKFDPERFSDDNKHNIKPFSYMPFGVGPRNCIGSRFALMEAKVVFVSLLSKFNFEICEKSQVPLKITKGQFNMNAEDGFWLAIKLRKQI